VNKLARITIHETALLATGKAQSLPSRSARERSNPCRAARDKSGVSPCFACHAFHVAAPRLSRSQGNTVLQWGFIGAHLKGANFFKAELDGADLAGLSWIELIA
jgi:hypothetical protein